MPIGSVVTQHAEVRTTYNLEVVGQARVRQRKVVCRQVSSRRILVNKASVRVLENFGVAMVFHHDEENVVQMRNTLRDAALLSDAGRHKSGQECQHCNSIFHVLSPWMFLIPVREPARLSNSASTLRLCFSISPSAFSIRRTPTRGANTIRL